MPVCGETLWSDLWNVANSLVAYLIMLESVAVLALISVVRYTAIRSGETSSGPAEPALMLPPSRLVGL